jgi:hypothetical protein
LVFAVLRALAKFEGRILTLVICKCKLVQDHFTTLYTLIGTLPVFISLHTLRLEEGSADGMDLKAFAEFLSTPRIRHLSLGKVELDASIVLTTIGPRLASVRHLTLYNARLALEFQAELVLSSTVVYMDLTRSIVHAAPLKSFLSELVMKPRRQLITLLLADLTFNQAFAETMLAFDIPDALPVLAEFSYSGNEIRVRDFPRLLNFLATQRNLRFLSLSRCFRDRVDEAIDMLAEFVVQQQLTGLEVNSDPAAPIGGHLIRLLARLAGRCSLTALICEKSAAGDHGLDAMRKFVQMTPKLTSLSCDGMRPSKPEVLLKAYHTFCKVDRLEPPDEDLSLFPGEPMPEPVARKPGVKLSPMSRALDYAKFDNETDVGEQPVPSLLGLMEKMATSLTNPEAENIFANYNMFEVFKNALVTTTILAQ